MEYHSIDYQKDTYTSFKEQAKSDPTGLAKSLLRRNAPRASAFSLLDAQEGGVGDGGSGPAGIASSASSSGLTVSGSRPFSFDFDAVSASDTEQTLSVVPGSSGAAGGPGGGHHVSTPPP